jgi:hypothetical protein
MKDDILRESWFSESDWVFLGREPTPMMDEYQSATKSQIDACLKTGFFEDVEYLKCYSVREDKEPLLQITLKYVDDDDDLIYLLRFKEVEELTLPAQNITDRGFMILSALMNLKKLTLIVPAVKAGSVKSEQGLRELKTRLPATQVVFQLKS